MRVERGTINQEYGRVGMFETLIPLGQINLKIYNHAEAFFLYKYAYFD